MWRRAATVQTAAASGLVVLGLVWLVIRFVGLEISPPGFWMDETLPATHAMCLAESGRNADGLSWPLYSRACGGGHHPLTLLGFDVVWIQVFGTSRSAFRAVSAFWIVLTCIGLFSIAWDLAALVPSDGSARGNATKRSFPWLVGVAALLSPWGFQFSRVAWEGPLAPAFLVLALVGLLRSRRSGRHGYSWAIVCGIGAVASMSTYPPLRAVVPLVLAFTGALLWLTIPNRQVRRRFGKRLLLSAAVTAMGVVPTLIMLMRGEINGRMNDVLITNTRWVSEHRGLFERDTFVVKSFLDNVMLHLSPSYLLISGDANPRHSSQLAGQLSAVDALAVFLAAGAVAHLALRVLRSSEAKPRNSQPMRLSNAERWFSGIALAAVGCGFLGVVPAALTYEGLPHALRSIGSWPFVAIFTGAVLSLGWAYRSWIAATISVTAALYSAHFLPSYFHAFDKVDSFTYIREVSDALFRGRYGTPRKGVTEIVAEELGESDEVLRYYLMHDGHLSCEQAAETLKTLRRNAPRK